MSASPVAGGVASDDPTLGAPLRGTGRGPASRVACLKHLLVGRRPGCPTLSATACLEARVRSQRLRCPPQIFACCQSSAVPRPRPAFQPPSCNQTGNGGGPPWKRSGMAAGRLNVPKAARGRASLRRYLRGDQLLYSRAEKSPGSERSVGSGYKASLEYRARRIPCKIMLSMELVLGRRCQA